MPDATGAMQDIPVLTDVRVIYPCCGDFCITFPLSAGDEVQIMVQYGSIENWLENGDSQDPQDSRRHDLSDCAVLPGFNSDGNAINSFDSSGLVIRERTGSGYIRLDTSGNVEINGSADFAVAFNDLKTGFDQLRSDFNTFASTHVHPGVTSGGASTGAAVTTPSTASIDASKVSTVKLP